MSGKPKGSKESYALLTAEFAATVDESHRGYRLWYSNGGWARLPVSKVQQVQEDWDPLEAGVSTFLFGSSRKGVLTDTLTIATDQATASFAKGASVQFASLWNNDERGFVDIVAANLAKDVSIKANGTAFVFGAGSPFVVASSFIAGRFVRDTKLNLDGNVLFAPKGSKICFYEKQILGVRLAGKPTFTVGPKTYEVKQSIELTGDAGKSTPLTVRFTTAKDYAFKIGTTSFTLPAGSILAFTKQAVSSVVFTKDTKVTLSGSPDTILAGDGIQFDARGAATKLVEEERE